jgi:hypothetical protein
MEDLCRVRKSGVGGGIEVEWVRSGIARSIRRTDAPLSASSRPAKGPGLYC